MKFLVVSDSHGKREILEEIVEIWQGKVDALFHCGDSELASNDKLWEHFSIVGGNMDFDSGYKNTQVVKLGNETIFETHGHLYGINFHFDRLLYAGEEVGASVILYGHLHKISCEMNNGVLLLNPGSISLPRGEIMRKAYAVVEATDEKYVIQYYSDTHEAMKDLYFEMKKSK
ncbi:hypothetical protein SAMN02745116_02262 [Pilibacter termitis]|uniref:Phosphoesterase n=1 Tax=Pilibacter termitis TaxID=263852 RepID=A0A1T4QPT0_9ENTE|nr:metallophosphoesterase [Pilibacter termitis]SKA05694.1 hypothetical protein SAMN02745116_02262 [Pilibacter termitis]